MAEIKSWQDPALIPPDAGGEDMTPAECWESCIHREACRMQVARNQGYVYVGFMVGAEGAARVCGCSEDCPTLEVS